MQNVVAIWSDAMNVVHNSGEFAALERTIFLLHELLEAIFCELLVFYVVSLVFFCKKEG